MAYYIAPQFLDKLAVHITKNYLDLPQVRVPLILGIHGRKGEGKTFQCELVYKKMGVEVVHVSGGELESPDAGDPARLIRLRYREAAEYIKVRGQMAALMINDIDAGAGRFDQMTQYTVNTQLVNSTLMNIADNPTNVQLPGSYDETPLHRVPIILTGNDLSTLYAPLIRDGRMEKFFWEPSRSDKVGIVGGIFEPDGLSQSETETLVDTFIDQAIDFFGALRSRIYDEQVRDFIHQIGYEQISARVVNSSEGPPAFAKPNFSLDHLLEAGRAMTQEQQRVREMNLVREYNEALSPSGAPMRPSAPPSVPPAFMANGANGASGNGSAPAQQPEIQAGSAVQTKLSPEAVRQIKMLIAQGHCIGVEHVDARRFRTNSWNSCASVKTVNEGEAISSLEKCLQTYDQEYVRLIGVDPQTKRRVSELIIQRP